MRNLLLSGLIFLTGCSLFSADDEGFNKALLKWQNHNSSNYEFVYHKSCFCSGGGLTPAIIVVRKDTVYQVLDPVTRELMTVRWNHPDSLKYVLDIAPEEFLTIDDLFNVLDNARVLKADVIDATYHPDFGYPESISIDYYKKAIDDEVSYSVSSFQKLN